MEGGGRRKEGGGRRGEEGGGRKQGGRKEGGGARIDSEETTVLGQTERLDWSINEARKMRLEQGRGTSSNKYCWTFCATK